MSLSFSTLCLRCESPVLVTGATSESRVIWTGWTASDRKPVMTVMHGYPTFDLGRNQIKPEVGPS